jgi:hypothetical protein
MIIYGQLYKDSEIPEAAVVTRKELSRRAKEIMGNLNSSRYNHCKMFLVRWGMPW